MLTSDDGAIIFTVSAKTLAELQLKVMTAFGIPTDGEPCVAAPAATVTPLRAVPDADPVEAETPKPAKRKRRTKAEKAAAAAAAEASTVTEFKSEPMPETTQTIKPLEVANDPFADEAPDALTEYVEATKTFTEAEVRARAQEFSKRPEIGLEGFVQVLLNFLPHNVEKPKLSDLQPKDYAAFMKATEI